MKKAKIKTTTIDEAELLYKEGKTLADIGKILGICPYGSLSRKLKERGINIQQHNPAKRYTVNSKYFEKIDNADKAYWLGFLMADAYIYQKRKKDGKLKSRMELGLAPIDIDHIKKFLLCVGSNNPIKERHGSYIWNGEIKKSLCVVAEIYDKDFVTNLISHGCVQAKSRILEFPTMNSDITWDFVRGYFDGDGSVHLAKNRKHASIAIASASPCFITSMVEFLQEQKIKTYRCKGKGCEIIRIYQPHNAKFKQMLYANPNCTFLFRKKDKFDSIVP